MPPVPNAALNAICPYFTMFPLEFPYRLLSRHARSGQWTLDPFSGRGTTSYASRLLGLPTVAIDSSPVAVALSQAKLMNTTPQAIRLAALNVLEGVQEPKDIPVGEFWDLAYHPNVLRTLCRFREGLARDCRSHARKALRAILMGALHGPLTKRALPSYFSNQSPRTYAPKPAYAARFWHERGLLPPRVDMLRIIEQRAERYYDGQPRGRGYVIKGDSRRRQTYASLHTHRPINWIVTSPPYYGMQTYVPDQWLRAWFLGGQSHVDYSNTDQMEHRSPALFAAQLKQVWENLTQVAAPDANLIIRFGGINDRSADPMSIVRTSLADSGWRITTIRRAGSATLGKRQASTFRAGNQKPMEEHDVWAVLNN